MQLIKNSLRAYQAEWLKLRNTGIWWMIAITCLFVIISSLFIKIFVNEVNPPAGEDAWDLRISGALQGFVFMYVLLSILIIVRLCQTEHRNQGWKLIETQPIHRAYLYIAKYKVALSLSLVSLVVFFFLSLISAYGYSFYSNETGLRQSSIPWIPSFKFILRIWIASWGFMAFQYMLSVWISNFAFPFIIGFVCAVTALSFQISGVANWFPYAGPILTIQQFKGGLVSNWLLHNEVLSIVWMLLFLWIGYEYYYFRSWKNALFSTRQVGKFLAAFALFALAFNVIEKPVTLNRYSKTVLAGSVYGDVKPDGNLVFMKPQLMDTLMILQMRKGRFHAEYKGAPLKPGSYALTIGNKRVVFFMSNNDSVHVDWPVIVGKAPLITGTRVAENNLQANYGYSDYVGLMKNKPNVFAGNLVDQWEHDIEKINGFRTIDNIKPSADFIAIQKKVAAVSYLEALKVDYPRMFAMYYPGDTLKYPASVDPILGVLNTNDTSILMNEDYMNFLDKELRYTRNFREYDYDSSFLHAVVEPERHQATTNVFLFNALKNMFTNTRDSISRNRLFNNFIGYEKDELLVKKLHQRLALENSLIRGRPAPEFEAISVAGKKTTLKDFKGRYVVIDVWATWCVPCKRESPFFDRYAEMYAGDKIAFVSLSVDEGNGVYSWQYEAAEKSKRVVQLRVQNVFDFMTNFGIEMIPRFILIDPAGNIVMMNMPRASDKLFEDYLLREVGI